MKSLFALLTIVEGIFKPIPLKSLTYSGKIESGVARIEMIQKYHNTYEKTIDVKYQLPILEKIVFDSFSAKFGDTTLEGKVKEKAQAKKEYEEAVNQGQQAAMGSTNSATTDIMHIDIGNIPAGQEVLLTIVYYAPLESVYNGNWEFKIPSTLTPRYNPPKKAEGKPSDANSNVNGVSGEPENIDAYTVDLPYTWDINLIISWPSGLKGVSSPSHESVIEKISTDTNVMLVKFKSGELQYPNKDFRIVIEDKELFKQSISVGKTSRKTILPTYAAMLQFIPDINAPLQDAEMRRQKMASTLGEYIFVIDRSGSMMGNRIVQARKSLIYFLKSLPPNSYFNVISFGSEFVGMPESLKYNDENLEKVISQVEKFDADMGGTEILQPIDFALKLGKIPNYQRTIFLLTDGSVGNSDEVVNIIKSHAQNNQARVFSIGIGNGCSETFIRRTAEVGHGKSLLLTDEEEDVQGKIIDLLNESLSPSLTSFEILFDKKVIKGVVPLLDSSSHILRNEPFRIYALVDQSIGTQTTIISVKYFDSVTNTRKEVNFEVTVAGAIEEELYHRVFLKKVFDDQPNYLALIDLKQSRADALTALSVAFQMWAPKYTSFICVSKDKTVNRDGAEKIVVPNIVSVDYNGGGFGGMVMMGMPMAAPMPMMMSSKAMGRMSNGAVYNAGPAQMSNKPTEALESADVMPEQEVGAEYDDPSSGLNGTSSSWTPPPAYEEEQHQKESKTTDIDFLISKVKINGSWENTLALFEKLSIKKTMAELKSLTGQQDETLVTTIVVAAYLVKFHGNDRSAQMMTDKARLFIEGRGISWSTIEQLSKSLFP
jgi:uncharacterized protein YegL